MLEPFLSSNIVFEIFRFFFAKHQVSTNPSEQEMEVVRGFVKKQKEKTGRNRKKSIQDISDTFKLIFESLHYWSSYSSPSFDVEAECADDQ
jgi:hypothetical protein